MRVVFLGTPDAAIPVLHAVNEEHEVIGVITQPDRPKGRSGTPSAPPVKAAAESIGLEVSQPESKAELNEMVTALEDLDLGVVVAYGRILSEEVLAAPRLGMLNAHFSLLPRWRGAAPVARALMAGDPMTGVTILKLDEGLDTGPILTAQAVDIGSDENAGELTSRLSTLAARLMVDAMRGYADGRIDPIPQVEEGATYASKLGREERAIDLSWNPTEIVNRVRGLAPRPGATLSLDGEIAKVIAAAVSGHAPPPGKWESIDGNLVIGVEGGGVEISTLHPSGKRIMSGREWLRGRRAETGVIS